MVDGTQTDAVKRAISTAAARFSAAFEAGDARRLVGDFFVPDELGPMFCPPAAAPILGRDAIAAAFQEMMATIRTIEVETLEVQASHELAHELGRSALIFKDGVCKVGRYSCLWMLVDGEWRAKVDFVAEDGWAD